MQRNRDCCVSKITGFELTKILGLCHKTLWKHQVKLKSKMNHIVGAKEKKNKPGKHCCMVLERVVVFGFSVVFVGLFVFNLKKA